MNKNKLIYQGLCDHVDGAVEDMIPSKIPAFEKKYPKESKPFSYKDYF